MRHYRERVAGIRYWEIANEPDIGESGGCPYRFKQNTPRPAYFAFKLLSRLAGDRLQFTSDHPAVHGFAAYDPQLRMFDVMLWNFSTNAMTVDLAFTDLPRDLRARHLTLNADSASNEENTRLRPDPPRQIRKGEHKLHADFEPYGVQFWMLE